MQSLDEAIAGHVLGAREGAGMSQADLARAMVERGHDFRQQTIYKIETGKRRVTIGEAVDLADSVGIELERLISGEPWAISADMRLWDQGYKAFQASVSEYAKALVRLAAAADRKAETDLERGSALELVSTRTPARVAEPRWLIEALLIEAEDTDGAAAQALLDAVKHDQAALGGDDG